jgi:hypothetical protein
VRTKLKGKHRKYCLCHDCSRLNIQNRDANCEIANELFALCVRYDLTTPVFECPYFVLDWNKPKVSWFKRLFNRS